MNKKDLEVIFNEDLGTSFFPLLAEEYLKEKDYDRALKVIDIGLLLNPNNNDGKYIKAKIAMIYSDTKLAVHLLKEILASDELYINAMKMLVLHYQSTNTNQSSMKNLLYQILDLLPGDEFAASVMKSIQKPKRKSSKISKKAKHSKQTSAKKSSRSKKKTIESKPTKVKTAKIDPKMATLTFVDILIRQKQYNQANNVLKVVIKNKSIAKTSIAQRQAKIKKGLSKEG